MTIGSLDEETLVGFDEDVAGIETSEEKLETRDMIIMACLGFSVVLLLLAMVWLACEARNGGE